MQVLPNTHNMQSITLYNTDIEIQMNLLRIEFSE